ncbi:MAG: shikimate kinase [Bacteroidota bacterium]
MKIFLVGLPGSGKTSLGRELASALTLPFFDLDKEIERHEQKLVKDLFKEKGEPYFRQLESDLLAKACRSDKQFVMATGGGAPCFFDNMEKINRAGISIFLDVPASEIMRRMLASKLENRPLLAASGKDGLKDQIEFLRSNRINTYRQAQFTFQGEAISVQQVLAAINPLLKK